MREMKSEKELGGILRNQKWKILQKVKDDPMKDRKKRQQERIYLGYKGRKCKFCGVVQKPREFSHDSHKFKKREDG